MIILNYKCLSHIKFDSTIISISPIIQKTTTTKNSQQTKAFVFQSGRGVRTPEPHHCQSRTLRQNVVTSRK